MTTTLTPAQLRALRFYAATPGPDRVAIGSPTYRVVDRLVAAGMLKPDGYFYAPTKAGRAALAAAAEEDS